MFKKARLNLTAFYLLIIVVILATFSLLLFQYTAQHLRDNLEEDATQAAVVERSIAQIGGALIFGDVIVIIFAGLLSYWLAGRTLAPIKSALDAQEQFSANASHELRTPLAVVTTDLEVFLKNPQPTAEDAKAVAARSLEEIRAMSGIVESLLALARSKKMDTLVDFEEVSLARPLETAAKKLYHAAEAKHLSLTVKKEADALVFGNEHLLEQLFFNVLQNAIAYTEAGSVTATLSASKSAVVRIADTGIGIAKSDLRHIFEPFYKADASQRIGPGIGLGLAIVKEIVEKHRGTIRVESILGKGTIIAVELPFYSEDLS